MFGDIFHGADVREGGFNAIKFSNVQAFVHLILIHLLSSAGRRCGDYPCPGLNGIVTDHPFWKPADDNIKLEMSTLFTADKMFLKSTNLVVAPVQPTGTPRHA